MAEQPPCLICNTTAETISPSGGDYIHQNCPRCGEFKLTGSASSTLPQLRSAEFIAKLSGWVRDQPRGGIVPIISSSKLNEVRDSEALTVTQRSQRLLLEAIRGQKKLGETFDISEPHVIAATHSQDRGEVNVLLDILDEQKLMKRMGKGATTQILPRGYAEAEKLKKETLEADGARQTSGTAPTTQTETHGATTFDANDGEETNYLLMEDGDRLLTEDGHPIELESRNKLPDTRVRQGTPRPSPIPWVGRPGGSHLCTSTIGIGGGLVGVTAVFVPYKGNFGRDPSDLPALLGWDGAEVLGEGAAGLDAMQADLRRQLLALRLPEDELDGFLRQLRAEPWITVSGSPLDSRSLPDDNTGII